MHVIPRRVDRATKPSKRILVVGLVGVERLSVGSAHFSGLGGAATYAGLAARRHGANVTVLTMGHHPELGKRLDVDELSRCSPPSFQLKYDDRQTITEFHYEPGGWDVNGCCERLAERIDELDGGSDFDLIHLCPLPSWMYQRVGELAPRLRTPISMQLHFEGIASGYMGIRALAAISKYVFMNRSEAAELTGHDDEVGIDEHLTLMTSGQVLVTSELGVRIWMPDDRRWLYSPASVATVVDPTGAGDTFAGAYLALVPEHGNSSTTESAARVAQALACEVIGHPSSFALVR